MPSLLTLLACSPSVVPFQVTLAEDGAATPDYQLRLQVDGRRLAELSLAEDGGDLTVVDDLSGDPVPFFLASFDPVSGADLWVRIPAMSPGQVWDGHLRSRFRSPASSFDDTFTKEPDVEGDVVAVWTLDEGSGGTVFDGTPGPGSEGLLVNSPTWTSEDGGLWGDSDDAGFSTGSALVLDGDLDFVRVPHTPELAISGPRTLELWLRPELHDRPDRATVFAQSGLLDLGSESGGPDGLPDMVVAHFSKAGEDGGPDHLIDSHVHWNSSGRALSPEVVRLPTQGCRDITVFDANSDGWQDVLTSNNYNNETVEIDSTVYLGGPEGFSDAEPLALPGLGLIPVCVADLDGDTRPELVFGNHRDLEGHRTLSRIYWNQDGVFSPEHTTELPTDGALDCDVADLDKDGFQDIVFANNDNDVTYDLASFVYWGSADGYSSDDRLALPTHGARSTSAVDLDADGWLDLFFVNGVEGLKGSSGPLSPTNEVRIDSVIYWGGPDGFSEDDTSPVPTVGAIGHAIADLDADGFLDLAVSNTQDVDDPSLMPSWLYWGGPDGYSADDRTELPGKGGGDMVVADMDQDGHLDLLASHLGVAGELGGNSYIYWGGPDGFDPDRVREVISVNATGMTVAGGHLPAATGLGIQPSQHGTLTVALDDQGVLHASYRDRLHRLWAVQAPVSLGAWQHVGVVLDTGRLALVVDGQLIDQVTGELELGDVHYASGLVLGADAGFQHRFAGALDQVVLWDRALPVDALERHRWRATWVETPPELHWAE